MAKHQFRDVKFIKTAVDEKGYPVLSDPKGAALREIAVAGRSNVGKSSLLNHLFRREGMVKTSSTPGKTQALNFFNADDLFCFVDLPGYGYAEVPLSVREKWGPMVQTYLSSREQLQLVLFLFDIRRLPNEDDMRMMEWLIHAQKAVILVLTKVDKVTSNQKKLHTEKILRAFNLENLYHVHYSSTKNIGRQELIAMISDAFC